MTEKWCADEVKDALNRVEERIQAACARAGRAREEVTLLAVTKTVEAERINAALAAGVTHIGENRVQEWLKKRPALHLDGVQKHLIGHLQTNKVRQVVGTVDIIESVDSVRLGEAIDREAAAQGLCAPVLVEVNIGGEESKSGVAPAALPTLLADLAAFSHLRVEGLMCVPPICTAEREKRAYFAQMHKLFLDIDTKMLHNINMHRLSMGMSSDFEEAILEGSTQVRVGTALFGKRVYF